MTIMVCEVVALIFERIERLMFNLPPRSSTPHEVKDVARAHPEVCDPTEVLDLVSSDLPVLNEIHPHVRVRGVERHVIDKAKPMHNMRSAVMTLIIRHVTSVVRCLHLLKQIGMIALFHPENIVQLVVV